MGRAIDEDGVIALIDIKVKALQEKVDEWNKQFQSLTPEQRLAPNDPVALPIARRIADAEARISAMNAVKGHLKFIDAYKFPEPRPLHELVQEDQDRVIEACRKAARGE